MDILLFIVGIGLAILVRFPLLTFKSSDFLNKIRHWYTFIHDVGFSAFATNFTTYNPPYLYQLYIVARIFPDLPNVLAIKIPSLLTDFVCAYFVFLIVRMKYPTKSYAFFAAFAFLFTPTVILNSAFWGQADVLFTAPLIAALYFLMKRQNTVAFIAFGIALAFKLQAIFLAPVLLGLLLRKQVSWRHFLLIPLVLFVAVIPAWLAGRPLLDLLGVYVYQTEQYQLLEMSAATVYTWLPDVGLTQKFFTFTGVVFTGSLGLCLSVLMYKSKARLTVPLLLQLTLVSVILIPFFLPKMHDRYFYPADVISVIYAFFFPQFYFVPVVIILASFFAYQPTLFLVEPVPMAFLAGGNFVMLVVLARELVRQLLSEDDGTQELETQ